jgi:hypothetical protein
MRPIKPEEVITKKSSQLPLIVFDVFNRLISLYWDGSSATILQSEVIRELGKSYTRKEIFDRHLLDVECCYRDVGWEVTYDKPAYNEDYDPIFTFRKATKV